MTPGLFLCPAGEDDVPGLLRLERATNTHPWTEQHFRSALGSERTRCILLKALDRGEQRIIGHCVIQLLAPEAEIHTLAVDPGCRRRGLGGFLLRRALDLARRAGAGAVMLEVRATNVAALRLYEAAGFRIVGHRSGYYRLPVDDALLLLLDLRPSVAGPEPREALSN